MAKDTTLTADIQDIYLQILFIITFLVKEYIAEKVFLD